MKNKSLVTKSFLCAEGAKPYLATPLMAATGGKGGGALSAAQVNSSKPGFAAAGRGTSMTGKELQYAGKGINPWQRLALNSGNPHSARKMASREREIRAYCAPAAGEISNRRYAALLTPVGSGNRWHLSCLLIKLGSWCSLLVTVRMLGITVDAKISGLLSLPAVKKSLRVWTLPEQNYKEGGHFYKAESAL